MKLNELNSHKVKLAPRAGRETPEQREARREHAKKAIASNFKKGFIGKATYDRQMKEQELSEATGNRQKSDIELARMIGAQGEKRIPANPQLIKELRQVNRFVNENNLSYARSWIEDMWLEYRGH